MTPSQELMLVAACVAIQAFFAGSEIAVVSADRLALQTRAEDGDRAAARALRPGGKIFGAFLNFEGKTVAGPLYGTNASDLLHRFSPHFEVEQLAPSGFVFHSGGGAANGGADIPQLEAVFVRR